MQSLLRGSKIRRLHKLDAARMDCFSLYGYPTSYRVSETGPILSNSGSITGLLFANGPLCHEIYNVSLVPSNVSITAVKINPRHSLQRKFNFIESLSIPAVSVRQIPLLPSIHGTSLLWWAFSQERGADSNFASHESHLEAHPPQGVYHPLFAARRCIICKHLGRSSPIKNLNFSSIAAPLDAPLLLDCP